MPVRGVRKLQRRMSLWQFIGLAVLVLLGLLQPGVAADRDVDGVPLPEDAAVAPAATALQRQWAGPWTGAWGGSLKHILLVESVGSDGVAQVVYAIGGNAAGIRPQWRRFKATVSEQSLAISEGQLSVTYEAWRRNSLEASYVRGDSRSTATMARADLAALTVAGATVDWTGGRSELLQTDLVENGKPVRLEAVIFRPSGAGPFPLAVINHGSTGAGRDPSLFKQTWYSRALASFLTDRGWLVAFPQRRGRGRSDGLYDEGLADDRNQGYVCQAEKSIAGADRALRDVEAAVASLRRRPDVASARMLLAGQSRGGVLSMVHAGRHPDQISGVINFVGGWVSDACSATTHINRTLFTRAASFDRSTLWLYGRNDPYYSIWHSQSSFSAFRDAGGKGEFRELDVPGGNGHLVMAYPRLWSSAVAEYLDSVGAAPR